MFLTFEASQANNKSGPRDPKQATTRRSERLNRRHRSTTRACTSCRQRKIRCDGETPCEACRWYKKAEQCSYQERERERHSQEPSPDYRGALERLFPETAPESIVNMPREKLLALISKPTDGSHHSQHSQPQDSLTVATSASVETHVSALSSLERPGLEALHSIPGEQEQLGENHGASASEESEEHISDDVNALSLPARNVTSYLGVSSIQAALKVIAWLHPDLNAHLSSPKDRRHHHNHQQSTVTPGVPPTDLQLLDAYFDNFQPFSPLLDEEACRSTFLSGHRKDDRWLALLNIMLALGSITAAGVDNDNHRTYFERSMGFLNFRTLGNPSLEVVQTLGLMGGWYCHYVSQPNLGYSLMGASLRLAVTLGLQHEPPLDSHSIGVRPTGSGYQELKRRIWWSLCCLEIWGHETLGRPSMDFFGPSITVKLPHLLDEENYTKVLPLLENIQFIKIASKIQESLAALPTLLHTEMLNLDSQLLQWRNNLPPILKDYSPCPDTLYAARTVMRWRFYNQRMLLYRPKLLNYAMSRIPLIAIKDEERIAVQLCREIAKTAIEDISATTATKTNQMIAWNAVWLMFQATMVPLIFLAAAPGADNDDDIEACKAQVQTAMSTLDRMKPYGHTAERSLGMILGILETVLHTPDAGVAASERAANGDQNMETQNYPLLLANHQPIARERIPDWITTTAGTSGATTALENYSSQQMWEYLSWGESNDFWQELQTSFNYQEEANFFDSRTQ